MGTGAAKVTHRSLCRVLALLLALAIDTAAIADHLRLGTSKEKSDSEQLVDIPDVVLLRLVEQALGKSAGDPVTRGDMATLRVLNSESAGVSQLAGVEHATNLNLLRLRKGTISDLTPLSGLSQLITLDLIDNAVADVSPLTGLTSLRSLWLAGNEIVDISPLADMTDMRHLSLVNNAISELSSLSGMTKLSYLYLNENMITDVTPLSGLTSLSELQLFDNAISDVAPLAANDGLGLHELVDLRKNPLGMDSLTTHVPILLRRRVQVRLSPELSVGVAIADPNLHEAVTSLLGKSQGDAITVGEIERLDALGASGVQQLSGIEYARSLEELYLDSNFITDLTPLIGLRIQRLNLSNNAISDISLLAGLDSLVRLYLSHNEISDISPLAGLTSLSNLHLTDNDLVDLGPLADLDLGELDLAGNEVVDVGPLADLTNLYDLNLAGNQIVDVGPLARLTSMIVLDLKDNGVVDIGSLAGMTVLESLDLSGNAIMDVQSLAGLTSLVILDLDDNEVVDIGPLAGIASLERLDLSSNAIKELPPLAGLTSLVWLDLGANDIVEIGPLASVVSPLRTLDLSDNAISDVSPLLGNSAFLYAYLPDGGNRLSNCCLEIDLRGNPLGVVSLYSVIPNVLRLVEDQELEIRLSYDRPAPLDEDALPRDAGLARAIEQYLAALRANDFNATLPLLSTLDASGRGVEELDGIEVAVRLRALYLDENRIADIAPLGSLGLLRKLTLAYNKVEDWSPLLDLTRLRVLAVDGNSLSALPPLPSSLTHLHLTDNAISDITGLSSLNLVELRINGNLVSSLEPLAGMALRQLHVDDNEVVDVSPLNFVAVEELYLSNNSVSDVSPLLRGERLLAVDVRRNPLGEGALEVLDTLRERGVDVLAGEAVPYFPAAGDGRQGFVRIINWGDEDGHVFIEAVDDAGVPAERVRLEVGAREAVHFKSADLERGSEAKGLGSGVGAPTGGDWRLSVISPLDVEVLSYIRTHDGFVTTMHDVAVDAMVPFFNPGSNAQQRSILRVVNTEARAAGWATGGYDDGGKWHPMSGSLLVRPQQARTLTAWALENAHGMGDGDGKWWLRARGFPWFAMSLLESPTGHLTNLSTAPANTVALADGRTMHRLPLFPAAGGAREGFVRLINRSYTAGEVEIHAVDDAGARSGPVRLAMEARQAVHFNSADLEAGNAGKGLAGRIGVGQGDWRLEIASELELTALGYARTPDGFLTSLHDLVPVAADGSHRVVFFNPGSNTGQVSKLRVINDGRQRAAVTVMGIDDGGSDSETVGFNVPAGSALTFTSAELEAGGDGLAGRIGDGEGKWRLAVQAGESIAVMSLLETPSGHLTNVSTGTGDPAWGVARNEVEDLTRRPRVTAAMPDLPLAYDGEATVDLSAHFSASQRIGFSASSSDTQVVEVSVQGSVLTLTAAGGGGATVTVTASDEDGEVVSQTFQVTVARRLPDQPLAYDGGATVDLSAYFLDSQALTFSATSSDTDVVRVSIAGSVLTVSAAGSGRATVTVRGRNTDGYVVRQTFQVVVAGPQRFQDCPECPVMVVVPAGSFMMGAPEDEEGWSGLDWRLQRVDIAAPFAIGAHEVTFAQWDACVAGGGCDGYEPPHYSSTARANNPVASLSWHDAQAYVAWLSAHTGETYRLPSEAEWEYAARAGTTTPFHFGETISTDQANYDGRVAYGEGAVGEYRRETVPVGSFPANAWGLHDVHGNVAEWTQDCQNYYWDVDTDAPTDGGARETGDCDLRVRRGGFWGSEPAWIRSASRLGQPVDDRYHGLRVVRELGE